jgi:hypothetical protein
MRERRVSKPGARTRREVALQRTRRAMDDGLQCSILPVQPPSRWKSEGRVLLCFACSPQGWLWLLFLQPHGLQD